MLLFDPTLPNCPRNLAYLDFMAAKNEGSFLYLYISHAKPYYWKRLNSPHFIS